MSINTQHPISPGLDPDLFLQAAELAKIGNYGEAEAMLSNLGSTQNFPHPALDLLARIRAQQGRFLDAATLWKQALEQDPSNQAYRTGLNRLNNWPSARGAMNSLGYLSMLILILILFIIGGYMLFFRLDQRLTTLSHLFQEKTAQPNLPLPLETMTPSLGQKTENVGAIDTASFSIEFGMPEVVVFPIESGAQLIFKEGIFQDGVRLQSGAKPLLTKVGQNLKKLKKDLLIQVIGYTDNLHVLEDSPFTDNGSLALARAGIAVKILRAATNFPSQRFVVSGYGEEMAPFSNSTKTDRLKNRTVEIRIFPYPHPSIASVVERVP